MIKVLIADDHPVVREGLERVIRETPDVTVVDDAEDLSQMLPFWTFECPEGKKSKSLNQQMW
jgi:chemotaxis response regulator CheB